MRIPLVFFLLGALLINAYPNCPDFCVHGTTDHVPWQPSAQDLLKRNQGWDAHVNPRLLEANEQGQSPKVLVVGCGDSRVDPAIMTSSTLGEIFVTRTVANMVGGNSTMAAVAYAIQDVGVTDVVVMGHTSCGGVAAAIEYANHSSWEPVSTLDYYLAPLVSTAKDAMSGHNHTEEELSNTIMRLNVQKQLDYLAHTDVVQGNWNCTPSPLTKKVMDKVSLHGWYYNISSGRIHDLNLTKTAASNTAQKAEA